MKKSTIVLIASIVLVLPFVFLVLGAIWCDKYSLSALANLIDSDS